MKHYSTVVLALCFSLIVFSNTPTDSLVRFSDLSFQSEFERQAFINCRQADELNLCLATDKRMTSEKTVVLRNSFGELVKLLEKEKLTAENIRKKFKKTHKVVFQKSPMQYFEHAEFSDILDNGNFNYLTASVYFSLVLRELRIPSYFLFTQHKSSIIINPDAEQIILESPNRKNENGYFNIADNKDYIVSMRDENVRIGLEYQFNASGGNSGILFNELDILKNKQLAATIYFYKANQLQKTRQFEEAYQLIRKACYLYPNATFTNEMYGILTNQLNACKLDRVEDVDLLGQLLRFKNNNFDYIKNTFQNIVGNRISSKSDLRFCTAAYNRLLPQINDVLLADEISYIYYLGAAYCRGIDGVNLAPALKALKLKPNDKNVLSLIDSKLQNIMYQTEDKKALIDTLQLYEKEKIDNMEVTGLISNLKLLLYLDVAKEFFIDNQPDEGVAYLSQFESTFKLPLPNADFRVKIENAYYEYARYYVRIEDKEMAQKIVDKGLQYIPNSNMIESATYNMPVTKPLITRTKMTKAEYDAYMKKNTLK